MTSKYFIADNGRVETRLIYIDETICDGFVVDTIYTTVAIAENGIATIENYSPKHIDAIQEFVETYGLEIA